MIMTHLKTAAALGVVAVAATGTIVYQAQQNSALRHDNQLLKQQTSQLQSDTLIDSRAAQQQQSELERMKKDAAEVFKLRAEVTRLKQDLARLSEANRRLKAAADSDEPAAANPDEASRLQEQKERAVARLNYTKLWTVAFMMYANDHQNQWPASFEAAKSYLGPQQQAELEATGLDISAFESVFQGKTLDVKEPWDQVLVLREKEPWQTVQGKYAKSYAFLDGHSEVVVRDQPEEFAEWEQQRLARRASDQ